MVLYIVLLSRNSYHVHVDLLTVKLTGVCIIIFCYTGQSVTSQLRQAVVVAILAAVAPVVALAFASAINNSAKTAKTANARDTTCTAAKRDKG
eukprot:COSAG05_NODE_1_length_66591_cov_307.301581_35_plen_93_part_00